MKNIQAVESDKDHEEEEPDKWIVTKKKALEYIDALKNYILSVNKPANNLWYLRILLSSIRIMNSYSGQSIKVITAWKHQIVW